MNKEKAEDIYAEYLKERHQRMSAWIPEGHPGRALDWTHRQRPRRIFDSLNQRNPYESKECSYCIDLANWYCDHCRVHFCRADWCKEQHYDEHTLSRLAGPSDE